MEDERTLRQTNYKAMKIPNHKAMKTLPNDRTNLKTLPNSKSLRTLLYLVSFLLLLTACRVTPPPTPTPTPTEPTEPTEPTDPTPADNKGYLKITGDRAYDAEVEAGAEVTTTVFAVSLGDDETAGLVLALGLPIEKKRYTIMSILEDDAPLPKPDQAAGLLFLADVEDGLSQWRSVEGEDDGDEDKAYVEVTELDMELGYVEGTFSLPMKKRLPNRLGDITIEGRFASRFIIY